MASSEITFVEHKIRLARGEFKYLNKQIPKNRDALEEKETEINNLILKYEEAAGQPYVHSLSDLALEFCEDYYADMDDNNNDDRERLITRYYHENCSCLIIGFGRLKGRDKIISNILTKFKNLRIKHDNIKITLDKIPPPGRMMVINCTATLKLDKDEPRKIKTIFEIEKCSADNSHPLAIVSELFQVLDSRPLYHHSEIDKIPRGTNDNWEPQFKPAFIEPEVIAVVEEVKAEEKKGDDEESLQEGESYEDDDESVQASIKSGSVESGSPTADGKHKGSKSPKKQAENQETLFEQLNEDTAEEGLNEPENDHKESEPSPIHMEENEPVVDEQLNEVDDQAVEEHNENPENNPTEE